MSSSRRDRSSQQARALVSLMTGPCEPVLPELLELLKTTNAMMQSGASPALFVVLGGPGLGVIAALQSDPAFAAMLKTAIREAPDVAQKLRKLAATMERGAARGKTYIAMMKD